MTTSNKFQVHAKPKDLDDQQDNIESYGTRYDAIPIAVYATYEEADDYRDRNESPDNNDTYVIIEVQA